MSNWKPAQAGYRYDDEGFIIPIARTHAEFFKEHEDCVVELKRWIPEQQSFYLERIPLEEFYQHFKARMRDEAAHEALIRAMDRRRDAAAQWSGSNQKTKEVEVTRPPAP